MATNQRQRLAAFAAVLFASLLSAACGISEEPVAGCRTQDWPVEGQGDTANYFPAARGDSWVYQESGDWAARQVRVSVVSRTSSGGKDTAIFEERGLDASGTTASSREVVALDATGATLVSDDEAAGPTAALLPYHLLAFPLEVGRKFVQVDCSSVDASQDLDGDGTNEFVDFHSDVSVLSEDSVDLQWSTVSALHVQTNLRVTVHASGGARTTVHGVEDSWFAAGIGLVKSTQSMNTNGDTQIVTRLLLGYSVGTRARGFLGMTTFGAGRASTGSIAPPPHPAASAGPDTFFTATPLPGLPDSPWGSTLNGYVLSDGPTVSAPLQLQLWSLASSAAFDGTNYLVAYTDGSKTMAQRVSPSGNAIGLPIEVWAGKTGPSLAVAFGGSVYVVFHDRESNSGVDHQFTATLVAPDGSVAAHVPIFFDNHGSDNRGFAASFDGTDFVLAWSGPQAGSIYDEIRAVRLSPSGAIVDSSPIEVCTSETAKLLGGIACNAATCLIIWQDEHASSNGLNDILAARISTAGALLDGPAETGAIVVNGYPGYPKGGPSVAFDGQTFVAVWALETGDYGGPSTPTAGIYYQRMSEQGALLDGPANGRGVLLQTGKLFAPAITTTPNGHSFVAWFNKDYSDGALQAVEFAW